jgi:hypothetical protein
MRKRKANPKGTGGVVPVDTPPSEWFVGFLRELAELPVTDVGAPRTPVLDEVSSVRIAQAMLVRWRRFRGGTILLSDLAALPLEVRGMWLPGWAPEPKVQQRMKIARWLRRWVDYAPPVQVRPDDERGDHG